MSAELGELMLRTGVVGAALIAGCFIVRVKAPTSTFRAACQHLGGGVLMGAVACELLPDITESIFLAPDQTVASMFFLLGFTINYLFLLVMARYVGPKLLGHEAHGEHGDGGDALDSAGTLESPEIPTVPGANIQEQMSYKRMEGEDGKNTMTVDDAEPPSIPFSLCLVVGQNCLMDGLLIGIAAAADEDDDGDAGWLLSISLGIDGCLMGVNTTNSMLKRGIPFRKILMFCSFVASLTLVGGLIAYEMVEYFGVYFDIAAYAFGVAGLLYIISEEYFVEAHEDPKADKWYVTIMFFVAFSAVTTYHLATHEHGQC